MLPESSAIMSTMELSQVLILPPASCGEGIGSWSGSTLLPGGASSLSAHLQNPAQGVPFFKVFFNLIICICEFMSSIHV